MSNLVLTRRPGQRVMINDDIAVEVVAIRNGQVRLSFQAPKDVMINREEIWEAIQAGKPKPTEIDYSNRVA